MTLPYDYTPAVLYAIDLISQGYTKTSACDASNINIATFEKYINTNTELMDLYVEADIRGADAMADALVTIDNHSVYGQSDPKMASIISSNIKWLLAKRKPKDYGEVVKIEHNITADKAIVGAIMAGQRRAALTDESGSGEILEAEFVEEVEEEDLSFLG